MGHACAKLIFQDCFQFDGLNRLFLSYYFGFFNSSCLINFPNIFDKLQQILRPLECTSYFFWNIFSFEKFESKLLFFNSYLWSNFIIFFSNVYLQQLPFINSCFNQWSEDEDPAMIHKNNNFNIREKSFLKKKKKEY